MSVQWEDWAQMEVVGLEAALAAGWADTCREGHLCTTLVKKGSKYLAQLASKRHLAKWGQGAGVRSVMSGQWCVQSVQSVPKSHPSY